MVSTFTNVHPGLDVSVVKDVADVTRSICNKKNMTYPTNISNIITDLAHDYILDEIMRHNQIKYEI